MEPTTPAAARATRPDNARTGGSRDARKRRVPFFKRTVPRPARAQHVLDGPPVPPRHESARGPPRGSARLAPGQGLVQVRSNFSQDEASHPQISYSNIEGRGLILNSSRTWTKTRTP